MAHLLDVELLVAEVQEVAVAAWTELLLQDEVAVATCDRATIPAPRAVAEVVSQAVAQLAGGGGGGGSM